MEIQRPNGRAAAPDISGKTRGQATKSPQHIKCCRCIYVRQKQRSALSGLSWRRVGSTRLAWVAIIYSGITMDGGLNSCACSQLRRGDWQNNEHTTVRRAGDLGVVCATGYLLA